MRRAVLSLTGCVEIKSPVVPSGDRRLQRAEVCASLRILPMVVAMGHILPTQLGLCSWAGNAERTREAAWKLVVFELQPLCSCLRRRSMNAVRRTPSRLEACGCHWASGVRKAHGQNCANRGPPLVGDVPDRRLSQHRLFEPDGGSICLKARSAWTVPTANCTSCPVAGFRSDDLPVLRREERRSFHLPRKVPTHLPFLIPVGSI